MFDYTSAYKDEFQGIFDDFSVEITKLNKSNLFITGATGLIGSTLIRALTWLNQEKKLNCKIIALARDINKAKTFFGDDVTYIQGDVETIVDVPDNIDFIIHGACPTSSSFMVSNPVEVIKSSVLGTVNLLEIAKTKKASFLFLSSMEAYGEVKVEDLLDEDTLGYVNPLIIRNCYPESKRMCEAITAAYASEYEINAKSIRLAQTFGPGISYNDKRIFAMIARSVIERNNIELKTKGESRHPYLYVTDAVSAILVVLLKGEKGKSYNAANPASYCSIYEMAQMVATEFGKGEIEVKIGNEGTNIYPNTTYLNLDVSAIEALGWRPTKNLKDMYRKLIEYMLDVI